MGFGCVYIWQWDSGQLAMDIYTRWFGFLDVYMKANFKPKWFSVSFIWRTKRLLMDPYCSCWRLSFSSLTVSAHKGPHFWPNRVAVFCIAVSGNSKVWVWFFLIQPTVAIVFLLWDNTLWIVNCSFPITLMWYRFFSYSCQVLCWKESFLDLLWSSSSKSLVLESKWSVCRLCFLGHLS